MGDEQTDQLDSASAEQVSPVIARALQVLPEGLYLMTSAYDGERAGMLVHSVMRASVAPPLIVVAARKGHAIDPIIRDSRCFAVGLVDPEDKLIRKRFQYAESSVSARGETNAPDPFDTFPDRTLVTGSPILDRCRVWMDCQIVRHVDLETDYELFVGLVVSARIKDQP
ncbi:MAG: flavin reductase [Planctomycetota bacterium]|nr:MAG: flavin reductase [Planctomycetota bacterium]